MSIMDWFRGNAVADYSEEEVDYPEIGLEELLYGGGYNLLGVTEEGTILVERNRGKELAEDEDDPPPAQAVKEIGGSSETLYRRAISSDYNPELSGQRGIDKYREMRNDAVVRNTLVIKKTPVIAARWFIEPASQEKSDQAKAKFVWDNLTKWMSSSFAQFLIEALYMADYGMYAFEKVFEYRQWFNPETGTTEEKLAWKKFAPRPPYEVTRIEYDEHGGPAVLEVETNEEPKPLPINKALVFTYDKEAGDLWGKSVLRSAYKHWFFKENLYKIDAIQKERHGIGIPIIILPPNFSPGDKIAAEHIGQNLRTNEKAHVVLPPGWEVAFLKLEGQRVDALASAQHHADKMYENVLANFVLGHTSNANQNSADILQQMFTKSARFTAEIICDVINHYAIPQLMRYNWTEEEMPYGYPMLRVRRLGDERDWRTISFAIRNFIGAKAMKVDDPLRSWIRDEMDLPIEDPETAFYVEDNPQNEESGAEEDDGEDEGKPTTGGTTRPPQVGLPRQSSTPPVGTPSANAGKDVGGGS